MYVLVLLSKVKGGDTPLFTLEKEDIDMWLTLAKIFARAFCNR